MIYAVAGFIVKDPAPNVHNLVRIIHPMEVIDNDGEALELCRQLRATTRLEEGQRLDLYILKAGEADQVP